MRSHKNCTHPKTTLARRECRQSNPEPPVDEVIASQSLRSPKPSRVEQLPPDLSAARQIKANGRPMTRTEYDNLPDSVYFEPLARIFREPEVYEYDILGRDEEGNYVRGGDHLFSHSIVDRLPLGKFLRE
ncbi:hypothetical protein [Tsukamurella tyrosinosolvens]|uniref:hypothetical protein n=1 Tax=Tsukamurella tyrosinosolvens TaxID=57704 RepID=UPI003F49CAD9